MPRSIDIAKRPKYRPAPPSAAPSSSSPRRKKSRNGFVFFVFLVGVITLGFSFNTLSKQPSVKKASTQKQTAKPAAITSSTRSDATKATTKDDSTKTDPAKDTTKDDTKDTTKTDSTDTNTNTNQTTALKIQILNGTGIETTTDQVKKLLESNNLPVESASKAQFEYGQTYIYYRPAAVETAKKISTILSDYKPTLSESQISGLFDVLVIIGKQSLPATQ